MAICLRDLPRATCLRFLASNIIRSAEFTTRASMGSSTYSPQMERNARFTRVSIEKDSVQKITRSLKKLIENNISFDRFIYVTNKAVTGHDKLVEQVYEK